MLADFALAGGRSTGLTELASPRFEEEGGAPAELQPVRDRILTSFHPQFGGEVRPRFNAGEADNGLLAAAVIETFVPPLGLNGGRARGSKLVAHVSDELVLVLDRDL